MYMATLSFTNNGDKWVAEQQVNADFALHIERKAGGGFWIYQRHGASGGFMPCRLPSELVRPGQVIDWTFSHGIYPVTIRIESETEVTTATLTEAQS